MTLPPSLGIPSIAPSCFSCFDYTNGLADVVVGYMGAPFDADADEMTTAALMVTVRNERGAAMLDEAVSQGYVQILQDGGHGGRALPSSGDRSAITMKTVAADSMVKTLTEPSFEPASKGAPPWLGNLLASLIRKGLPTGMEFGRFSIDYHYLRNALFVEQEMGGERAGRHVPAYARALMQRYEAEMDELRKPPPAKDGRDDNLLARLQRWLGEMGSN
jgi:7-hydroxymethyl chlorophyll a reductase